MEYCLDLQFKIFSLGVRRTDKFWSRSSVLNINMIPSLWISGQKRPNTYFITSIKNILHWIFLLDHNKTLFSDPKENKNIRDWNFLAKTIPRDRSRSPLGGNLNHFKSHAMHDQYYVIYDNDHLVFKHEFKEEMLNQTFVNTDHKSAWKVSTTFCPSQF